jgi:hypothetical protein
VGLGEDDDGRDHEDHREHREGVALERVHQVVAEERDGDLQRDDDDQAEDLGQVGERVQRERAADAVHREPADARRDRVQPGREHVPPVAEAEPGQHHLGHAVLRAAGRQDALRDRAAGRADHDGQHRLPEAEPERGDREDADKDRGELQVGRGPGPEELQGPAVPLVQGDELGAAGLDGHEAFAVVPLAH